jgi:hypothetical protein
VLERLNGKSVSKAFSDKKFADIHYIRGMMLEVQPAACGQNYQVHRKPPEERTWSHINSRMSATQVFTALDKAQRAFG